ncbi:sensor histidine kinase [Yinghuangia seranimata]|uniref:sensor histidine kinase n=1 Tax=Yinghuangia seranimata TaxID=408067 RepID=UPI00248CC816|nr:sensor histidine kinase [Yinghuangia seranimata]MDI2128007.1 sensor histidine kinase [Yinghuangia seranimata]
MQSFYEWLRRHPVVVDVAGACALFVFGGVYILSVAATEREAVASGFIAMLLCLSMALRRVQLHLAAVGVVVGGLVQLAAGVLPTPVDLAMIVVLHTAAKTGSRGLSRFGLAMAVVGPALMTLRFPAEEGGPKENILGFAFVSFMLIIAWVLGDSMRTRRAYYAELEDRAARLERERETHAQIAAASERARIARELHDVVAHNVSVMVVQADGAAYAIDAAPDRARDALGTISTTGREALAEMRRLLGVLRSEAEQGPYAPQPGVDQLGDLVDRVRDAGLPVELRIEGVPVPLSQGVALAAYRIVQEALTNTRKHAGPAANAAVVLAYGEDGLAMTITDNGRGADAPGDGMGHGLVGMRERVAMLGGQLDTGPDSGPEAGLGGWRVRAVLPYASGLAAPAKPTVPAAPPARPAVVPSDPAPVFPMFPNRPTAQGA